MYGIMVGHLFGQFLFIFRRILWDIFGKLRSSVIFAGVRVDITCNENGSLLFKATSTAHKQTSSLMKTTSQHMSVA